MQIICMLSRTGYLFFLACLIRLNNCVMKCPRCKSTSYSKNGFHKGKQKYICKHCGRQWVKEQQPRGYPQPVRNLCVKMYHNGLEAKEIGQYTGISYNTITNWIKQAKAAGETVEKLVDAADSTEDDRRQHFITSLYREKLSKPSTQSLHS